MKTNAEIQQERRILIETMGDDGGMGWIPGLDSKRPGKAARVIWSNGGGWDHVSVSWENRCPTWEEMCRTKDLFFYPEEYCVEYHPAQSEYVNHHPFCLHIWRYQQPGMPMPPSWMVGPKRGQDRESVRTEGLQALQHYEDCEDCASRKAAESAAIELLKETMITKRLPSFDSVRKAMRGLPRVRPSDERKEAKE